MHIILYNNIYFLKNFKKKNQIILYHIIFIILERYIIFFLLI